MIEVKGLSKQFAVTRFSKKKTEEEQSKDDPRQHKKQFNALEHVNFSCESGQALALLGPNGAGKTTALRILSSAIKADSGHILVDGVDVIDDPLFARQQIGFLSGTTGLYHRLTVRENIRYFAELHNVPKATFEERLMALATRFDMLSFLDKRAEQLSAGMKQKASIVRSVIHDPKIIILDEPTTGLDIPSRQAVIEFVLDCKQKGTPVILSTHYLDEVTKLCERVSVINLGRTVFNDSLDAFSALGNGDLHTAFMHCVESPAEHHDVALASNAEETANEENASSSLLPEAEPNQDDKQSAQGER